MKTLSNASFAWILMAMLALSFASCTGTAASSNVSKAQDPPADTMYELLRRQPNIQVTGSVSNPDVQIRGGRSLTGSDQPLYLVNGRRMGTDFSAISFINPQDVERINIIRDPADLASYGVGAGNGVVDVILKK